jgi:hypothetical protein
VRVVALAKLYIPLPSWNQIRVPRLTSHTLGPPSTATRASLQTSGPAGSNVLVGGEWRTATVIARSRASWDKVRYLRPRQLVTPSPSPAAQPISNTRSKRGLREAVSSNPYPCPPFALTLSLTFSLTPRLAFALSYSVARLPLTSHVCSHDDDHGYDGYT